jgi:hypothetical protein
VGETNEPPRGDGADDVDQLGGADSLQRIAVCARLQRLHDVLVALGNREHDDLRGAPEARDAPCRFNAAAGHGDVEQHQLGPMPLSERDSIIGGATRPDDLEARALRKRPGNAVAIERVVVGNQHPKTISHRFAPCSGRSS